MTRSLLAVFGLVFLFIRPFVPPVRFSDWFCHLSVCVCMYVWESVCVCVYVGECVCDVFSTSGCTIFRKINMHIVDHPTQNPFISKKGWTNHEKSKFDEINEFLSFILPGILYLVDTPNTNKRHTRGKHTA